LIGSAELDSLKPIALVHRINTTRFRDSQGLILARTELLT